MLSGECSYDQWVVLAGKKMCGKNYRIEANKKVKGASKCAESDRRTKLKFAKINNLASSSSSPLPFRIPADPRAPEAFTLNITTTRNKSKRRCLTQVTVFFILQYYNQIQSHRKCYYKSLSKICPYTVEIFASSLFMCTLTLSAFIAQNVSPNFW